MKSCESGGVKLIAGIGKVTACQLVREIRNNNGQVNFSAFSSKKFYPSLKKISSLVTKLNELQQNPVQAIELILTYYKPILESFEDDYETRFQDLEVLTSLASKYRNVERFLSDFTLEPPSNKFQDSVIPQVDQFDEKPLTVSTIHSAKGLEWHTVFVPHAGWTITVCHVIKFN